MGIKKPIEDKFKESTTSEKFLQKYGFELSTSEELVAIFESGYNLAKSEDKGKIEKLKKALEFYANWANTQDGKITEGDCELMIVHAPLDKDKHGVKIGGKLARQILKGIE